MKAKEQPAGSSLGSAAPSSSQKVSAPPAKHPQSTANGIAGASRQQHGNAVSQQPEKTQPHENGNSHPRDQNGATTGLHCLPVSNDHQTLNQAPSFDLLPMLVSDSLSKLSLFCTIAVGAGLHRT